ncbi:MAG: cation diffusion facilitator family transporter [Cyclobacteriaceae bacterium]
MAGSSKKAIFGAITANSAIAICKFIASYFTGSASMLSEGIHSLVDTGNGVLLLVGIKRSQKSPNIRHPYGYGKEIYFWSFVVAILIFALGGGIALYEGILHIQHPKEISSYQWNYIVLSLAIIFEGFALRVALKEFNKSRGNQGYIESIKRSKDSATVAIVIEDTAALLGLLIALLALVLGQVTGIPYFDGLGSICIGLLLVSVSFFFAYECKGLLIGEGLSVEEIDEVESIIKQYESVVQSRTPLSMYFGPGEVLLNVDLQFKDELNTDQIEENIDQIEQEIRNRFPKINRIYIEADEIKS